MSYWKVIEKGDLPTGPGCYVVYIDGELVYVGSTTRLQHRCRVYRGKPRSDRDYDRTDSTPSIVTPWGRVTPDSVRMKAKRSRRLGDWLMWEYRLIRRLRPRYNRAGVKF